MATPYLWYTGFTNSTTITNHGSGGAAYNGTASSNLYKTNSVGHPMWGPMNGNSDRIAVPGGISSPHAHSWEIGLNISQWWPVDPVVVDGILCGNDGKLWASSDDLFYGYLHEECSYDGTTLRQLGTHYFTVELQGGCNALDVEFWLGVGNNKPTKMTPDPLGIDDGPGVLYQSFGGFDLKLNQNYYFQVSVSASGGASGSDYYIGNCAQGCADAFVSGFPCGCYIYCWREFNSVIDFSGGGDWAADVPIWAGGTPPNPSPSPTPSPGPGASTNLNMNASVREYQPGNY
jgi:hypothetical protein